MWVVMMAGMMLPSIAPGLFRYAGTNRWSRSRIGAFVGGYLLVWTGFALAATVTQRLLSHGRLLSPMMDLQSPEFSGALLILAGLYQLTPFKRVCLQSCRCEARLASQPESARLSGSFRLGVTNGLCCLGCCWALMLLLFVVGVMNLRWMIALSVLVLLEKAAPIGARSGRMLGLPIIAAGIWILVCSLA
jgi:predicted metal-binding membrane protein